MLRPVLEVMEKLFAPTDAVPDVDRATESLTEGYGPRGPVGTAAIE